MPDRRLCLDNAEDGRGFACVLSRQSDGSAYDPSLAAWGGGIRPASYAPMVNLGAGSHELALPALDPGEVYVAVVVEADTGRTAAGRTFAGDAIDPPRDPRNLPPVRGRIVTSVRPLRQIELE